MIEWFAPGYKAGGPIQSCVNLCIALKESHEIYVLTTDTDHGELLPYEGIPVNKWTIETDTGVQVYYAKKKALRISRIAKIIEGIDPDFIYLNLLFSPLFVMYPLWLKYSGRVKAKMILCPRGTLYDSAISLRRYKKKPMLQLLKYMGIHRGVTFHATNQREEKAVLQYFPGSKIVIADNLPNILQPAFITCEKITGSLRCIFIARIVPIKNLLFLLQLLKDSDRQISLTIVGPVENENYWADCKKAVALLPGNVQVEYLGPKQNAALLNLLQSHHLFVLPTTGENFGHAIFEALRAGRPVLISDQTPWQDLYKSQVGWVLPLDSPGKYIEVINKLVDFNQAQFDQYAKAAWAYANNFVHNPGLTKKYKEIFN